MKNKIDKICSSEYSFIVAEYSKFHISNISHLCFELTYLSKALETNGVNDNTLITIKTNLRTYKQLSQILYILTKDENLIIFLLFIICTIMIIITYLSSNKVIEYLSTIFAKHEKVTVSEALSYHRVKDYLFYNNDSPLKGINIEEATEMTSELLNSNKQLTELVIDCRKYFIELKLSITSNVLSVCLLLVVIFTFLLLLHALKIELGVFRVITIIVSFIFIILVLIICFKIIMKSENIKKDLEKEPNNKI
jgi:hypothetical protein